LKEQRLSGPLWSETIRSGCSPCRATISGTPELVTWLRPWSEIALDLGGNNTGEAGAAALRTALETNYTLDALEGVGGVDDILERNRGVRVARKQQVVSLLFFYCRPSHVLA
jgi:hypothetical protein